MEITGSLYKNISPPGMGFTHTLIQTPTPTTSQVSESTPRIIPLALPAFRADKGMAASFLQYCAMCEKQIMTPCNSILYCSEACRRKDDAKPLSASLLPASYRSVSAPTSPSSTTPVRSGRETHSTTPVVRIPPDLYDHKSDLDPTEWKPKLQHRGQSDAYQYLSKFHAALNAQEDEYVRVERRRCGHKHNVSMTTTPSLGNTPSTAASSVDSIHDSTRPLSPRTNPMYTLSAGAKSVDLVTPHIPPPIVGISTPADSQMTWDKKVVLKNANNSPKGVGILFSSAK